MSLTPLFRARGHDRNFPHLDRIRKSINRLYDKLSVDTINSFSTSFSAEEATTPRDNDIIIGVQLLAGAIVRHLRLPKGSIIVSFREMENPGQVELTEADDYLVDLSSRYRDDHKDIAAILAHEITHVFLHRHGIRFPDTLDNEILTDTTACYLGVGWLSLNAYRVTETHEERDIGFNTRETRVTRSTEKLGYLTPEEFGYVLGKRSLAFREGVDGLFTSPAAKRALIHGLRVAARDHASPPLVASRQWQQLRYRWHLRYVGRTNLRSGLSGRSRQFGAYRFDVTDAIRVIFGLCARMWRKPRIHWVGPGGAAELNSQVVDR